MMCTGGPQNWNENREECQSMGYDLAIITSLDEQLSAWAACQTSPLSAFYYVVLTETLTLKSKPCLCMWEPFLTSQFCICCAKRERSERGKRARSAVYSVEGGRQWEPVRLLSVCLSVVVVVAKIYSRGFSPHRCYGEGRLNDHYKLSRFFELPIVFSGHFFASIYSRCFHFCPCCYEGCFLLSYTLDNFRFAVDRWGSLLVWHIGGVPLWISLRDQIASGSGWNGTTKVPLVDEVRRWGFAHTCPAGTF